MRPISPVYVALQARQQSVTSLFSSVLEQTLTSAVGQFVGAVGAILEAVAVLVYGDASAVVASEFRAFTRSRSP